MSLQRHVHIITAGGTIDGRYDPTKETIVPLEGTAIETFLDSLQAYFSYSVRTVTMKDSRDITDEDREGILREIERAGCAHNIVTHGTYTMPDTGRYLQERIERIQGKVVMLTGSMVPLHGFAPSDGPFNLGFAIAEVFHADPGVYLVFHGRLFDPRKVLKNVEKMRFEEVV